MTRPKRTPPGEEERGERGDEERESRKRERRKRERKRKRQRERRERERERERERGISRETQRERERGRQRVLGGNPAVCSHRLEQFTALRSLASARRGSSSLLS